MFTNICSRLQARHTRFKQSNSKTLFCFVFYRRGQEVGEDDIIRPSNVGLALKDFYSLRLIQAPLHNVK